MRTIEVKCIWQTHHVVEVPDDVSDEDAYIGFTLEEWWADQLDASCAELTDWSGGRLHHE